MALQICFADNVRRRIRLYDGFLGSARLCGNAKSREDFFLVWFCVSGFSEVDGFTVGALHDDGDALLVFHFGADGFPTVVDVFLFKLLAQGLHRTKGTGLDITS